MTMNKQVDDFTRQYNDMPDVPDLKPFVPKELVQEEEIGGGFEPANNKVVVYPDPIPRTSEGGIAIPDEIAERQEFAQIFATLCAVGPDAWAGRQAPAAPGDRVMIAKYTGQLFTGADGNRYRVIHDLDIIGKVTQKGVCK
jgi:co-chaperonin GroES (HSP10)